MAIVDYTYYSETYFGEPVATADFPRYEARAEAVIDSVCRGQYSAFITQLTEKGYTAAAQKITSAYMNAICAQIEYYVANGILSVTAGQTDESFTVGKVSVSTSGAGAGFETRGTAMLSPSATLYLEQTGLLGRCISAPVEPFAPFPLGVV